MYSVIIQNKVTTEAFLKYQPLFMDAINNDRIGVCKWNESGTTIDTAVPELRDLTDDKEAWDAYIIRFQDGRDMQQFEVNDQNPYDFLSEEILDDEYQESKNPLIRLTHMLGVIPEPEAELICEEVEEAGSLKMEYRSEVNPKKVAKHKELCEKYAFDGIAPSKITIITVREGFDKESMVANTWDRRREVNSSEFWKRNRYPSNTRFLVYDFEKKGPVQRVADEFGFWLSVMLLVSNKLDNDVISAYRLYHLNTTMNKELMAENFQQSINRVRGMRLNVEEEIKKSLEKIISAEAKLPDYRLNVPVVINLPIVNGQTVNQEQFGLLSKGTILEMNRWRAEKNAAEKGLETSIRTVERTLDIAADRIRGHCGFVEEEVDCLDMYQVEDMTSETYALYQEIVDMQGKLPMTKASDNPAIEEAEEKVFDNLRGRVVWENALEALLLALFLIILVQIPAIVNLVQNKVGSIWFIVGSILVEWIIVIVAALIVAQIQKIKTHKLVEKYNELMRDSFHRLMADASIFTDYLSDIASHVRGYSYLNLSKKKVRTKERTQASMYKFIKSINLYLAKMKEWSKAYHLELDFDADVRGVSVNAEEVFTFEVGKAYPVEVNKTGKMIDSPFSFVERLEIVREELYDDDGSR